ncbi:hypothetical protein [Psychromicrobium xiongbiense]|uniref:hypothetical protein n=1 Tax=Psychromicrobium xiongbiense TaxID=3051184 RepID=UPI00255383E6|nr:hypothetical protein [Psychromicrobium sp. YIM S02556]
MFSQISDSTPGNSQRRPGRWAAVGPIVLAVVFLVALVLAANNNTVLGWFIAAVALAWLILATLVYIGVVKAARFGAEQVRRVRADLSGQQHPASSSASAPAGTRLVDESPSHGVRDTKLDHSFKIVQVQARVIRDEWAKADGGDQEIVARALETIDITAHNGRDMLGVNRPGDDTISGVVID